MNLTILDKMGDFESWIKMKPAYKTNKKICSKNNVKIFCKVNM